MTSLEIINEEYKIFKDPYYISRNIFKGVKFTEYEEKKYNLFIDNLKNDKDIINKFSKYKMEEFLNKLILDREEIFRYLNMFKYDVDLCLTYLIKIIESMNKLKIRNLIGYYREEVDSIPSWIEILDNVDKKNRPLIGVTFPNYSEVINLKNQNNINLNTILYFFSTVITEKLIPGHTEQFNLLINTNNLNQNNLLLFPNYDEIIKILQFTSASRINKIYVLIDNLSTSNKNNPNANNSIFSNVNRFIFESNKEKIHIVSIDKLLFSPSTMDLGLEIENDVLIRFFMSTGKKGLLNHDDKSICKDKENFSISNSKISNDEILYDYKSKSKWVTISNDDKINPNILALNRDRNINSGIMTNSSVVNRSFETDLINSKKEDKLSDDVKLFKTYDMSINNSKNGKFNSEDLKKFNFQINLSNFFFVEKAESTTNNCVKFKTISIQNHVNNFSLEKRISLSCDNSLKNEKKEINNLKLNPTNKGTIIRQPTAYLNRLTDVKIENNLLILETNSNEVCCKFSECFII